MDCPRRVGKTESYVIELPNRSLHAGSYVIEPGDLRMALDDVGDAEEVAIWHTHPSGLIGPSEGDLRHRLPEIPMVVVALTDCGPHPTWF